MLGVILRHRLSRALGRVNFTQRTSEKNVCLVTWLASPVIRIVSDPVVEGGDVCVDSEQFLLDFGGRFQVVVHI